MVVTDVIGDFIIRIKNANRAQKETVTFYASKKKEAVAQALVRAGFIASATKTKNGKMLEVKLAYNPDQTPKVSQVERISKPSRRVYQGVADIKPFKNGFGAVVFSTPAGILTNKEAAKQKVGGEALFKIW